MHLPGFRLPRGVSTQVWSKFTTDLRDNVRLGKDRRRSRRSSSECRFCRRGSQEPLKRRTLIDGSLKRERRRTARFERCARKTSIGVITLVERTYLRACSGPVIERHHWELRDSGLRPAFWSGSAAKKRGKLPIPKRSRAFVTFVSSRSRRTRSRWTQCRDCLLFGVGPTMISSMLNGCLQMRAEF